MRRLSHDFARQKRALELDRRGGAAFNRAEVGGHYGWHLFKARILFERATRIDPRQGGHIGGFFTQAASSEQNPQRRLHLCWLAKHFHKKVLRRDTSYAALLNVSHAYQALALVQPEGARRHRYESQAQDHHQAAMASMARSVNDPSWPHEG